MFKIIAVFKKASKAQNPFNNFYFNTHKCIGNIAYFILNQNMKKHQMFYYFTESEEKGILGCSKNSSVQFTLQCVERPIVLRVSERNAQYICCFVLCCNVCSAC